MEFELFRYQILPKDVNVQTDAFGNEINLEEIIQNKNMHFYESLLSIELFINASKSYPWKEVFTKNDWLVFKLANIKRIVRENESFEIEQIDNFPSVNVILNNSKDIQVVAISRNSVGILNSGQSVVNIIESSVNCRLEKLGLICHFKPIIKKKEFWKIIRNNSNKIESVNFELISPNMAKISKSLSIDLKRLHKETNTQKTNIRFESAKNESLYIDKDNDSVSSLVEYSERGGGEINVKIAGLKKKVSTSKSTKTMTLDSFQIENISEDSLNTFVKNIFKDL